MTLVLSVVGTESVWTVADRRLTESGRIGREDARKIMFLETTDGVAILAYAGLGSTARGTEPADWMSAVLRGRNWPLEQSLAKLAEALKRELPSHLANLRVPYGPSHNVLITGFVNDEPRIYSIDLALSPDKRQTAFRHTRWVVSTEERRPRTPTFAVAGSGCFTLASELSWRRHVLRLVRAYDRRRITARTVADGLAAVNYRVSMTQADHTVGPRCIVAWRNRKTGTHREGGGHKMYTGTARDRRTPSLPTIGNGLDIHAIVEAIMPHLINETKALAAGNPGLDFGTAALKADLSRLSDRPDEKLR